MKSVLVAGLFLSGTAWISAEPARSTSAPQGEYKVVALELSDGLQAKPQQLRLSFRGESCVQFWFLEQGYERINLLDSRLKLTAKKLEGRLKFRLCPMTSKREDYGFAHFDFNLNRDQKAWTGRFFARTFPGIPGRGVKEREWEGTVKGRMVDPVSAISGDPGWPSFAGPQGTMSVEAGADLMDDLNQARPVWQSEARIPVSYGNAADDRYFWRAAGANFGGGSSSPVVVGDTVYQAYYQPSSDVESRLKNPFWERKYPDTKTLHAEIESMNMMRREVDRMVAHFIPLADDVVVAMDARTGATRWKTVFPKRAVNLQTHKHRGLFGVPLVADDKLYYPNMHGRLYALDTKNGRAVWEWPRFEKPPETKHRPRGPQNPSALLLDDTLVWMSGKTYGLDPETGKEKWVNDTSGYGMQPWHHDGRWFVLANTPKGAVCIEIASGKTVWTDEAILGFSQGYGNQSHSESIVVGDRLISFRKTGGEKVDGQRKPYIYRVSGWHLSPEGMKQVWEDEPMVPDENLSIAVHRGVAYCIGKHLVRGLDIKTGRHLGSITEAEFGEANHLRPRSNAWLSLIGDRMLLSPEGQHGKHGFLLYDSSPSRIKQLGDFWVPPHHTTTAYNGQPLVYPIVDGRIFMRGGDAIYCYDLRKK